MVWREHNKDDPRDDAQCHTTPPTRRLLFPHRTSGVTESSEENFFIDCDLLLALTFDLWIFTDISKGQDHVLLCSFTSDSEFVTKPLARGPLLAAQPYTSGP